MFTRIEKRGMSKKSLRNVKIFTLVEGEDDIGAEIEHEVGSNEVTIRSNVPTWGSIPVNGRESLRLLRDALIEVCKERRIK